MSGKFVIPIASRRPKNAYISSVVTGFLCKSLGFSHYTIVPNNTKVRRKNCSKTWSGVIEPINFRAGPETSIKSFSTIRIIKAVDFLPGHIIKFWGWCISWFSFCDVPACVCFGCCFFGCRFFDLALVLLLCNWFNFGFLVGLLSSRDFLFILDFFSLF